MVKPKQSSKKKPKGSIDFKKIKRKIGRKLPPPRNTTNTQVKSKAIVLLEQSLAIDRTGLAVNNKGLTLRELLQQTSHHNAKTRKAALNGIKDLVMKFPSELELHKLAIIQKLSERICDNDKVVRETLYHILKTVIFPHLKEDISGPTTSLMMAYVFNAMTHIAVDIRLMAFKYFELVVSSCPSSFFLYAEKVLDNYIDILRNNQIYLQDKSKLKNALGGLVQCLSLLANKKGKDDPSEKREDSKYFILNSTIAEIFLHLSDRIKDDPLLFEIFFEFIEDILLSQDGSNLSSNKVLLQKHLGFIIPFFPGIIAQIMGDWRTSLLKAFTVAFGNCKVNSKMTLAYLSAIEEMLLHMQRQGVLSSSFDYDEMLDFQIAWLQELPKILLQLDDNHSSVSKVMIWSQI